MSKAEQFWNWIAEGTDLQDEVFAGQTLVEITGNERVLIENHCGVKLYERDRIEIHTKNGIVHVCGQCLQLIKMSREVLIIRGQICQVNFQRRR